MEKVLVIDDSLVQAEYLKLILQDEYDVTVCQTGADGFLQAMSGEYSLIFLETTGNSPDQIYSRNFDYQPFGCTA